MRFGGRQILLSFFFIVTLSVLQAQTDSVVQRIFLVGDAGEIKNGKHPTLDLIRFLFPLNDIRNTVVYLGDNIYPAGLPDENAADYLKRKSILDTQINLVKSTAANAYIIPGNHDWMQGKPGGWRQVVNQSRYIESLALPNVNFIPQNGCPGPVEVQLGNDIVLVAVDSQWWLEQEARPGVTSDCDCKTESEVIVALKDLLYRNRDKLVIFAAHHPFRSHGIHGGYFTFKQHIFPLTDINPKLYLPLPVIGSLYPIIRGGFGNIQDLKHPEYKDFISQVDAVLSTHPYCIRVAGHEHSLQYLVDNDQNYIVSGAGSKSTRIKNGKDTKYSAGGPGFAMLEMMTGGAVSLKFYTNDDKSAEGCAYEASLKSFSYSAAEKDTAIAKTFPDSIKIVAAPYYKAGSFKEWLLGKNYRDEWATPVMVKILDIGTEKGGLKPVQRGGGFQSKSLRLEDANGRQYVLRSIEKYPDKVLPDEFRQTFVKDVIVDGISASYPYAALSIPPLAAAAGVPHANPLLRYIPDDPRLGQYRIDFANSLCIFEEREPGDLEKTYSTLKVVEKLQEDNDNKVNQHAVLRARLLDMFIMDFDRHEDQWRWGADDNDKGKTYFPIPRDRDQAFFISDGFIPSFIRKPWIQPKFQGLRPHAININTFNFNARYFDRSFLNELSQKEWSEAVDAFLPLMTDTVIEIAIRQQPTELKSLSEDKIIETLKQRRQFLKDEMQQYYKFLAKEVDIAGTDKKELFEITRNDDASVKVIIYKINKEGEANRKLYERLFLPGETKEIRLYGMGGEDRFEIKGKAASTICVRIIGGTGNDVFDNADANTAASKTKIYDLSTEENKFTGEGKWKNKLSDNPAVNQLDRRAYQYNILAPLISVAYNPDDGVFLGMSLKYTRHAFRKKPHSVTHFFRANYALATGAYNFSYRMDAVDVIGKLDLLLFGNLKAPNNTQNFFGIGNDTEFPNEGDQTIKYYRSRYNLIESAAMLRANPTKKLSFLFGPVFQRYWIDREDNEGRFINEPSKNGLDSTTLYQAKSYAGLQFQMNIDGRNNLLMPSRGVNWQTYARWVKGTNSVSNNFGQFSTDLSLFTSFNVPANIVIGFRIGGGINWGNYEFFQAQYLSGTENLRGYRKFRFAGDKMVYNNIDIRIHLADFKGYIFPGSLGIVLFNDIGRVWVKNEKSSTWHNGVGGGLWLAPAKRYVVTACYAHSKDGGLPFISLGYQF